MMLRMHNTCFQIVSISQYKCLAGLTTLYAPAAVRELYFSLAIFASYAHRNPSNDIILIVLHGYSG